MNAIDRLLLALLGSLPLWLVHGVGGAIGWFSWLASPTYRRHLRSNLTQALGDEGYRRHWRGAVWHAGCQSLEVLWLWQQPVEKLRAQVREIEGRELLEQVAREGQGVLFMTPHLGCFEITAQCYAAWAPITVLYREPRRRWLGELIQRCRARGGVSLAPADMSGVRRLIKALRQGEAVGMLPDQVPGKGEGIWVPFFGRPAYTMTLAARLSEVSGVRVIFTWARRLPWGQGFALCFRLVDPPLSGDTDTRAVDINRRIEDLIRECPEQYLWGYNRYKRPAGAPLPGADA